VPEKKESQSDQVTACDKGRRRIEGGKNPGERIAIGQKGISKRGRKKKEITKGEKDNG